MSAPRLPLAGLIAAWERFWFRGIPPESYALLRIVFGVLGLVSLLAYVPVDMYWALDGIVPLPGGGFGFRSMLLDVGLGTAAGWLYFLGLAFAFVCMTLGIASRWAVAACLVGSVLQKSWNNLPLTSGHEVLIAALFYLVWADSGSTMSVDAWRAGRGAVPSGEVAAQPIWPLRLLRFQVALIYLNSGLWKFFGPLWRDGSAVHYAVSHNIFRRFPQALPVDLEWLLTLGTYGTLAWEIAFPFLILFRRTRAIALIVGLLVHGGIWATIEVGSFSWLIVATYIAFLDPDWVARTIRTRLAKNSKAPGADRRRGVVPN
jgi:hypothetical protein